jgi:DNA-directed RNA polymerase II subunit RPB11
MNAPERFEFLDEPNQKKISFEKDTKIPNAATITIFKEDHTLGNLLRMQLLRDPNVIFAGYKVPHPLDPLVIVKVQTQGPVPGPLTATHNALVALGKEFTILEEKFRAQLQMYKSRQQDRMQIQ